MEGLPTVGSASPPNWSPPHFLFQFSVETSRYVQFTCAYDKQQNNYFQIHSVALVGPLLEMDVLIRGSASCPRREQKPKQETHQSCLMLSDSLSPGWDTCSWYQRNVLILLLGIITGSTVSVFGTIFLL